MDENKIFKITSILSKDVKKDFDINIEKDKKRYFINNLNKIENCQINEIFSLGKLMKNSDYSKSLGKNQTIHINLDLDKYELNSNKHSNSNYNYLFAGNLKTSIIIKSDMSNFDIKNDFLYLIENDFSIENYNDKNLQKIKIMSLSDYLPKLNHKIKFLTSNEYVFHAIDSFGNLFSWGDDNLYKTGILGQNSNYRITTPSLNEYFHENKIEIDFLSISDKHCIATSKSNQIFTWGSGLNGELIENNNYNQNIPNEASILGLKGIAGNGYSCIISLKGGIFYFGRITQNINLNDMITTSSNTLLKCKSKSRLGYNTYRNYTQTKKSDNEYGKTSNINDTISNKKIIIGLAQETIIDIIPGANIVCILTESNKIFLFNEEIKLRQINSNLNLKSNSNKLTGVNSLISVVFYGNDLILHTSEKELYYYKFQTQLLTENCKIDLNENYKIIDLKSEIYKEIKNVILNHSSTKNNLNLNQIKEKEKKDYLKTIIECFIFNNFQSLNDLQDNIENILESFMSNIVIFDSNYLNKNILLSLRITNEKLKTDIPVDDCNNSLNKKRDLIMEEEDPGNLRKINCIKNNNNQSDKNNVLEDLKMKINELKLIYKQSIKNKNFLLNSKNINDQGNNVQFLMKNFNTNLNLPNPENNKKENKPVKILNDKIEIFPVNNMNLTSMNNLNSICIKSNEKQLFQKNDNNQIDENNFLYDLINSINLSIIKSNDNDTNYVNNSLDFNNDNFNGFTYNKNEFQINNNENYSKITKKILEEKNNKHNNTEISEIPNTYNKNEVSYFEKNIYVLLEKLFTFERNKKIVNGVFDNNDHCKIIENNTNVNNTVDLENGNYLDNCSYEDIKNLNQSIIKLLELVTSDNNLNDENIFAKQSLSLLPILCDNDNKNNKIKSDEKLDVINDIEIIKNGYYGKCEKIAEIEVNKNKNNMDGLNQNLNIFEMNDENNVFPDVKSEIKFSILKNNEYDCKISNIHKNDILKNENENKNENGDNKIEFSCTTNKNENNDNKMVKENISELIPLTIQNNNDNKLSLLIPVNINQNLSDKTLNESIADYFNQTQPQEISYIIKQWFDLEIVSKINDFTINPTKIKITTKLTNDSKLSSKPKLRSVVTSFSNLIVSSDSERLKFNLYNNVSDDNINLINKEENINKEKVKDKNSDSIVNRLLKTDENLISKKEELTKKYTNTILKNNLKNQNNENRLTCKDKNVIVEKSKNVVKMLEIINNSNKESILNNHNSKSSKIITNIEFDDISTNYNSSNYPISSHISSSSKNKINNTSKHQYQQDVNAISNKNNPKCFNLLSENINIKNQNKSKANLIKNDESNKQKVTVKTRKIEIKKIINIADKKEKDEAIKINYVNLNNKNNKECLDKKEEFAQNLNSMNINEKQIDNKSTIINKQNEMIKSNDFDIQNNVANDINLDNNKSINNHYDLKYYQKNTKDNKDSKDNKCIKTKSNLTGNGNGNGIGKKVGNNTVKIKNITQPQSIKLSTFIENNLKFPNSNREQSNKGK